VAAADLIRTPGSRQRELLPGKMKFLLNLSDDQPFTYWLFEFYAKIIWKADTSKLLDGKGMSVETIYFYNKKAA
jgi:hypothetical protein